VPSSGSKSKPSKKQAERDVGEGGGVVQCPACFFLGLLLDPKDGGDKSLRKVCF
jgi:hypothetical protein